MRISLNDTIEHVKTLKNAIHGELELLYKELIEAKDSRKAPIYAIKYRAKSHESTFLKIKRKPNKTLTTITDYAGVRVLCLFSQHLIPILTELLIILPRNGYNLKRVSLFNYEDSPDFCQNVKECVTKKYPQAAIEKEKRVSGYKSVHMVIWRKVGDNNVNIEVQLRTLLQDVWGELEHALSYKKGSIHPHIKKSFIMLAQELDAKDQLMSHLKDINDKESSKERYSRQAQGTVLYFDYDPPLTPKEFKRPNIANAHAKYCEKVLSECPPTPSERKKWCNKCKKNLDTLSKAVSTDVKRLSENFQYFVKMENAYILLKEAEYDEAEKIYKSLLPTHENRYVIHLRLGEVNMIKGNIELALECFDRSDELASAEIAKYTTLPETIMMYRNMFHIKRKQAYVYWMLGSEYIDISIDLMHQAEDILDRHAIFEEVSANERHTNKYQRTLLNNNLCWYYLEQYIVNDYLCKNLGNIGEREAARRKSEAAFHEAGRYYEEIDGDLSTGHGTSNAYDTAAWYLYQHYQQSRDKSYLDKAKIYCHESASRINVAVLSVTSMDIHANHIAEIMRTE